MVSISPGVPWSIAIIIMVRNIELTSGHTYSDTAGTGSFLP